MPQWEEYVDDIEAQMRRLLADNAHLQAALADVRGLLQQGGPGANALSNCLQPSFVSLLGALLSGLEVLPYL